MTDIRQSATIHLGATSLSLLIQEHSDGETNEIEYLEQPIPLARDVFRFGKISHSTQERCVEILKSYLKSLKEYALDFDDIKYAAITNIVNEAQNYDALLNRLQIATGLIFTLLDDGAMSRLIYLKTKRRMTDLPYLKEGTSLVLHVGPGNTRAILLKNGQIERYYAYRLGSHRTSEALHNNKANAPEYLRLIRASCRAQVSRLKYDFRDEKIESVLVIGREIQQVASRIHFDQPVEEVISSLKDLLDEASNFSEEERVFHYNLDYHAEDGLLPALQIIIRLLQGIEYNTFYIPDTEFEKGILIDLAHSKDFDENLEAEVMRAARRIAVSYQADPNHFEHVLKLSEQLFVGTQELHQMQTKDLLLLKAAAILHEIGGFVSSKMHHKHSQYLIQNSEVFGLTKEEQYIVALVSRYHRQSAPKESHTEYMTLPPEQRILVSKLSALLRVADALDSNHTQRVQKISLGKKGRSIILKLHGVQDAGLERIALDYKGQLFEELFGHTIILEEE